MNLDVLRAAILYVGLIFILGWRALFPWRPRKHFSKEFNYISVLYYLLLALYVLDCIVFGFAAVRDFRESDNMSKNPLRAKQLEQLGWPRIWLRTWVLTCPFVVLLILVFCWRQSMAHLDEIRDERAITAHDRALQILAIPATYSVMTLSALAIVYSLVTQEETEFSGSSWEMTKLTAFGRYEICFYVAELWQAWALYQFGVLTIEQLEVAVREKEESPQRSGPSTVMTFEAMSSVILVGTYLFVAVTFVQSAAALYLFIFTDTTSNWDEYENTMSQFTYAGMVASAAAIYNVHTVEHTFSEYLGDYFPFTKFLSVKLLVFFAFWQNPILWLLHWLHILTFTEVQVKLMTAAMLVMECGLCALMHWWAWDPKEAWYDEKMDQGEKQALLSGTGATSTNPFTATD